MTIAHKYSYIFAGDGVVLQLVSVSAVIAVIKDGKNFNFCIIPKLILILACAVIATKVKVSLLSKAPPSVIKRYVEF